MGYVRLGKLPRTRKWQQVTALLAGDAGIDEIAAAASDAAERALKRAADDPALLHAFWLLTQIPLAAQHPHYLYLLQHLGLKVNSLPSLWELVGAFADAVDTHVRLRGGRTDLGEMAQLAATESLTALTSQFLPSLFGSSPEDVQAAVGQLGTPEHFNQLSEDFFARLTRRHLEYYLSRALSDHVGPGRRLATTAEHTSFNAALDLHCRETVQFVRRRYSRWWLSTPNLREGITPESVKAFTGYAFDRIQAELRRRRDADD